MNIKDLANKYKLEKDDFWHHQQSGQWIITHNAVEKIATIENIYIKDIKVLNSEEDLVRMLITMGKKEDGSEVTSIGEADRKNCRSQYLGCLSEKRGIDRCVLKLINAYEYGISSEIEAEDFKKPLHYRKTEEHLARFDELLKDKMFDGKRSRIKDLWKEQNSLSKTHTFLNQMEQRINENNEKELENDENY
tara:strand:- start:911 stop:1486 length:576 start_codon:yes stop_codon:yes gene_type:complete